VVTTQHTTATPAVPTTWQHPTPTPAPAFNSNRVAFPAPAFPTDPLRFRQSPLDGSGAALSYHLNEPTSATAALFSFIPVEISWEDYERFMNSAYEAIYECK